MSRLSTVFMLMFAFAFSVNAAGVDGQFGLSDSCQLMAQEQADNNKDGKKKEEPEPDCE